MFLCVNTYRYCPLNFISFIVIDYINENLDETIKLYVNIVYFSS